MIARSPEEQSFLMAALVVAHARAAILQRSHFDFVLSGGSTPKGLFQNLGQKHRDSLAWEKVRFFWSDERDVPPGHPNNNFNMANELLLKPLGIPTQHIFRVPTELGEAAQSAEHYRQTLRMLYSGAPEFDLAILGVGEDGHTASLFPDAWESWSQANQEGLWVTSVWVPHLQTFRITLLPDVLSATHRVFFLISGASKATILQEIIEADTREETKYPAQLIQSRCGRSIWLVDQDAASLLQKNQAA